jgi:hypothetical protein
MARQALTLSPDGGEGDDPRTAAQQRGPTMSCDISYIATWIHQRHD